MRLELAVAEFDRSRFADAIENTRRSGVVLTTLAAMGDTEAQRRQLYELNKVCSADIPERGQFYSWEEYRTLRLQADSFDPSGVVLAIEADEWIGLCASSYHADGNFAFNEMTGVVRSHRRRGIALALKLGSLDFVEERGAAAVRTVHHPDNHTMISLNRRLGYVDADWA